MGVWFGLGWVLKSVRCEGQQHLEDSEEEEEEDPREREEEEGK